MQRGRVAQPWPAGLAQSCARWHMSRRHTAAAARTGECHRPSRRCAWRLPGRARPASGSQSPRARRGAPCRCGEDQASMSCQPNPDPNPSLSPSPSPNPNSNPNRDPNQPNPKPGSTSVRRPLRLEGAAVIFFSLPAEARAEAAEAAEAARRGKRRRRGWSRWGALHHGVLRRTCRFRRVGASGRRGSAVRRRADQAIRPPAACLAAGRARGCDDAAMAGCAGQPPASSATPSPPRAAAGATRRVGGGVPRSSGCARGVRLGVLTPRNSWHDGLACFALLASGAPDPEPRRLAPNPINPSP